MSENILLSIVVPTKDRYYYLKKLIDLIIGFNSSDIELVIQDNTYDNTEILDYLSDKNSDKLRYFHRKEHIPISDNSTEAIINSKGEFVCFIGDDDGVLPSIVDAARYMKTNKIDALLSQPVIYNWPDFSDNSIFKLSASLLYKKGTGEFKPVNSKREIQKCLNSGIRDLFLLPKVYQGIVRRGFLDKVYQKTGTFFPGASPDMANAIALALLNPILFLYDSPLIISGQCKTVGGGERLLKNNKLPRITEMTMLPRDISETWDDRIPRYWCADTIWPQSAISAYKKMGEKMPRVDFNHIIATFIFDHPAYYKECKSYITNYYSFGYYYVKTFVDKGIRFLFWRLSFLFSGKKKRAGVYIGRNFRTISDAIDFLTKEC